MTRAAGVEMGDARAGGASPATASDAEAIRHTELFAGCDEAALAGVMHSSSEVTLANGDLLFSETDRTKGVWVVLDGELVISKMVDGDEVVIDQLRPGGYLGEIS